MHVKKVLFNGEIGQSVENGNFGKGLKTFALAPTSRALTGDF
jgi:hypothetical protein